jgi:ribosomal subunit interface protein
MTLQVTGKNVDAGEAFKDYISEKIGVVLEKYIGPELSGHVRLEKEKSSFRTDCSIRLRTGLLLETHGLGQDAYSSADAAVERLEKRVRRYKRRLKDHHARASEVAALSSLANDYVVQVSDDEAEEASTADHPIIIAESERSVSMMSVGEAVMRLDLGESNVFVFRNAGNKQINVVYRRPDGNVGWVDLQADGGASKANGSGAA